MTMPLKVLHISSFVGNVGDNASHIGFYSVLSHFFPAYEITELEIRKSYSGYALEDRWRFDETFVQLCNAHDLVLIGGGVFLNFWIKGSVTGTTLDITEEMWSKITTPILLTSIGCVPNAEIPEGNIEKFVQFIDLIQSTPHAALAVRNDGSKGILEKYVGDARAQMIPEVLDSGFFFDTNEESYRALPKSYIALNVTFDQIRVRGGSVVVDESSYYAELQTFLRHILTSTSHDIVFVPHIYTDHVAIARALEGIDDFHIRSRIQIAPYVQGERGCHLLFSIYKRSAAVVGTRFHSNVCSLSMDVPSVGLVALDRVKNMYDGLQLSERYVRLDQAYSHDLIEKVSFALDHSEDIVNDSRMKLDAKRADTLATYTNIFSSLGLS